MKINPYETIEVKLLQQPQEPNKILAMAASMTMKKDYGNTIKDNVIKEIIEMGHTSILEHLNYTFMVEKASRSFLAQMTRHRMASYTSASQHYQNYSEYDARVSKEFIDNKLFKEAIESSMDYYNRLIKSGIPNYEARQVLPNAMENNLLITINARSLQNFFSQRMCYRNVDEMRIVAEKMYNKVNPTYPELFNNMGRDCETYIGCRQGKMECKNGNR